MVEYRIEPIDEDEFPKELRTDHDWSRFDSTFSATMKVLERELNHLNARPGSLVIKTFHRPYDVLKSGKLRPETKKPSYPGVIVWFEVWDGNASRYEPMQFECDSFNDWKANLRAIALAMEALRKVERYVVSSRGREDAHTAGFRHARVEARTGAHTGGELTVEAAAAVLVAYADSAQAPEDLIRSPERTEDTFKIAAHNTHPDKGGTDHSFAKVSQAIRVLRAHHRKVNSATA